MGAEKTVDKSLDEKQALELSPTTSKHQEDVNIESVEARGDYSGAAAKTDPVEIKLVRKLDRRILVSCVPSYSFLR